jgi:GNAT superfamily N-acetyltransferase
MSADEATVTPLTKQTRTTDFSEVGSTGITMFAGQVHDEFLRELRGDRGRKVLAEMRDNDPVVGAVLFALDMLMRQVEWEVVPAQGAASTTHQKDLAEFVHTCLHDMSSTWDDTLSGILSMAPFGWSYCEIVYKKRQGFSEDVSSSAHDDGRIGWRKLPLRLQRTIHKWELDDHGGIQGMWQVTGVGGYKPTFIPITKALLFRTSTATGSPEGRSILRNAYRPWFFKNKMEEIEGIGVERDLAGLPVGWVPPSMLSNDASDGEKLALQEIAATLRNIRRDENEGILFPLAYDEGGKKLYDLTLLSSAGSRQFETDKIISRYDQRIAMTALADFILLGHEKVGSFALGSTKVGLFTAAMDSWLQMIASVFNAYAVPRLMRVNGEDPTDSPRLVPGEVAQVDVAQVGEYITKLAGAGMTLFPDADLEARLRQIGNLPPKSEEAEAEQQAAAQMAAQAAPPGGVPGRPANPDGNPSATKTPSTASGSQEVGKGVVRPFSVAKHVVHDQRTHGNRRGASRGGTEVVGDDRIDVARIGSSSGKPPPRVGAQPLDWKDLTPAETKFLRSTYEGSAAGLTSSITSMSRTRRPPETALEGEIRNADGKRVGSWSIELRRQPKAGNPGENETVAHHGWLRVDPSLQGRGFARAFNQNLEDTYRRQGVAAIELTAALKVGGYLWARKGYDWAKDKKGQPKVPMNVRMRVADAAYGTGRFASEDKAAARQMVRSIRAGKPPTPYEIASLGYDGPRDRRGRTIGQKMMLGSYWNGRKEL